MNHSTLVTYMKWKYGSNIIIDALSYVTWLIDVKNWSGACRINFVVAKHAYKRYYPSNSQETLSMMYLRHWTRNCQWQFSKIIFYMTV